MATKNWQKTFNDLAKLADVYEAFGEKFRENPPEGVVEAFAAAVTESDYTALDHSAYHNVRKVGADVVGYEESSRRFLKFLKSSDPNLDLMLTITEPATLKPFLPEIENPGAIRALAARYELKGLQKLLP